MAEKLKFKISSALKNIIGKDLITDDFVAVFELVKNSYDAYANKVIIEFNNLNKPQSSNIKIIDNGKGMDYDDLVNKWLFVAYSAKQEGTEDDNFNYRDLIYAKRLFAGAKGIGRFSCDRLGKYLYLETKKMNYPKTEILLTDWEKFEGKLKDEFININVLHESKPSDKIDDHHTILQISKLRNSWDRKKLLLLKDSLAKLINPSSIQNNKKFNIELIVPEEIEKDRKENDYHKIINGPIKNFIFEEIGLRTTKIQSNISGDGRTKTTELYDGGTFIYRVKEKSNHIYKIEYKTKHLKNVKVTLFYLNRSAKYLFSRRMGLASRLYGHIFLYKNGFRVFPYGEPNEDPLKIDVRKSRKTKSRLGTGEMMGQIEVYGDRDNDIMESSTRGDGLIKNSAYECLNEYVNSILERFEKYVVDVQKWGLSIEDPQVNEDLQSNIAKLISNITESDEIIEFEYPENLLDIINASQSESAEVLIKNLNKIAVSSGDQDLMKITAKASKHFIVLNEARREAEIDAKKAYEKAKRFESKLDNIVSENLFLKSIKSQDFQEVLSFIHHMGIYASTIDGYLKNISLKIAMNETISKSEIKELIRIISFEVKKIMNISSFATKANFKMTTEYLEIDIVQYIREYTQNILSKIYKKEIIISLFSNNMKTSFVKKIKPIELNIVLDNLINNSKKAKAKNIYIYLNVVNNNLNIRVEDDGIGIEPRILPRIFDFGFTTTEGSGLGLYHVKQIIKEIGGSIEADYNKKGAIFNIWIRK